MKYLALSLLAVNLYGQAALSAELRADAIPGKTTTQSETLHYSVNWPSGLSLGEGTLTSSGTKSTTGETWNISLTLEAAVPGFPVSETVTSKAATGFCTTELEKTTVRGKKTSKETTVFDAKKMSATRTTSNGGGKSEFSIPGCAKDALSFIFFLRRELAQGRLPAAQRVFHGAAYDTRVQFMGTQKIRVGEAQVDVDRIVATIKGPASDNTIELFFARDAVRTPVVIQAPLAMGKFSMEIVR